MKKEERDEERETERDVKRERDGKKREKRKMHICKTSNLIQTYLFFLQIITAVTKISCNF